MRSWYQYSYMGHTKNIFCHESRSIHSAVASGFLIRLETVWKNQYTFDRDKFAKSVLEQGWLGGSDVGRVFLPPRFSIRSPSPPSPSLPSNQPALKSCNIIRSNQLIMAHELSLTNFISFWYCRKNHVHGTVFHLLSIQQDMFLVVTLVWNCYWSVAAMKESKKLKSAST